MITFFVTIIVVLIITGIVVYLDPAIDHIIIKNKRKRIIWYNLPSGRTYSILW